MNKKIEYDIIPKLNILLLIFALSGVFGFIYEEIFYRIDLGYFVKRGTTFGPWIPIYGFGGIFITLIANRFRKSPIKVFALSGIISGVLEFLTGYVLFHFLGIRLWDYNVEIWNFGNIGGYICFRSILFFAVSGLFLIYGMYPFLEMIKRKMNNEKIFTVIALVLSILFIIDMSINAIIKF